MSSSDWLPNKDQDLRSFATDFSAKITAAPATYGLVAADASSLETSVSNYSSALDVALDPATRTRGTIGAKNTAKAVLIAEIRSLGRRIQAYPPVTAQQKLDLGLRVHDKIPTPTPPPATKPLINVVGIEPRAHVIRLSDETTPDKRARPVGAIGAKVYSFVGNPGDALPGDLEMWRFEGLATRAQFIVDYEPADNGKQGTIVARWFNRKGEPGPVSLPVNAPIAA